MKKIVYIILSLILLLTLTPFYACGGGSGDNYGQTTITPKQKAVYPVYKREERPVQVKTEISEFNTFSEDCVKWLGRNRTDEYYGENAVALTNVASGFSVSFKGSRLTVRIYSTSGEIAYIGDGYIRVYVDGESRRVPLTTNNTYYDLVLASGLDATEIHTVKMLKATEEDFSRLYVSNISTDGTFYTPDLFSDIKIDFYGDSITAGFGILGRGDETALTQTSSSLWDGTLTFAAKVAEYLDADYNVICKQGIALSSACDTNKVGFSMKEVYQNYSVYDATHWDYSKYQPDIIVINLGTNDYSSLIGTTAGTTTFNPNTETDAKLNAFLGDYAQMIENLHTKCPKAKILCCLGMMNGVSLYSEIENMVNGLRKNGADYVYSVELFTGKLGAFGHPSVSSNEVNAGIVLEALSAYCGINARN